MDPRGNKGTKTNCLKRLVCVERQEMCQDCYKHISKQKIQGCLASPCVRETEYSFHFQYDPSWDVRMIQYEKKISYRYFFILKV